MQASERQNGWTLFEALRRCADRMAFAEWVSARRQAKTAGSRRYVLLNEQLEGSGACAANARTRARRALHNNEKKAAIRLERELWSFLIRGQLVAYGRRASPLAEPADIPQTAWKSLRLANWRKSAVREPSPDQTQIFDVRVFPVLDAPTVARCLDGKTLVEVLEQHVLKDPQVDCLRRHATVEGGTPASFGWGLGQKVWPLSYGHHFSPPDPFGALLVNPDADRASVRAADWAMAKQFGRLIYLLTMGEVDAIGVPSRGGTPTPIPRSMWIRDRGELDLANGDLGEFIDEGNVGLTFKPFFSGLILRAPMLGIRTAESIVSTKQKVSKSSTRVKSNIDAERECEDWLATQMKKSPKVRPKRKQDWLKEARQRWPNKISEMRFRMIWSECIRTTGAHAWSYSGAPKRIMSTNRSPE